jgi:hypothetical protein
MVNRPKSQSNTTQAVISTDQNFILAKNISNFMDIISPFKKVNNRYISQFILPITQLHRIQLLYETMPAISQYTVVDNLIKFDCVSNLPADIFENAENGYIHFSAIRQYKKDEIEIVVDPKRIFGLINDDEDFKTDMIMYNQKIRFKSSFLKAFPIILKNGFIFSIVNKSDCQLFISIDNPKNLLVGECSKFEVINLIQYIVPLWQIFNININKTIITIKLLEEFITDKLEDETAPILLYLNYNLEQPNNINFTKIANNIVIPKA